MADFEEAVNLTLIHEGKYVNNPADRGGATNMGISQASFPLIDIKDLTVAQAKDIYEKNFWRYSGVLSQPLANKIFDMAVVTGHGSTKVLQELVGVAADGMFGMNTEHAVNAEDATQLLKQFRDGMVQHFMALVTKNPSQYQFLQGWLNRVKS